MKSIRFLYVLTLLIGLSSCEDVIDVDLKTARPRLVVEASINWVKGTPGNEQLVKLSTTTDYFAGTVPPISGADVTISDSNGAVFTFAESGTPGTYSCTNFVPTIGETYTLTIDYDGQMLSATETMMSVVSIDSITQEVSAGFGSGDDRIDIKTNFTDPANVDNYYMSGRKASNHAIAEYFVTDDAFFQGNPFFDLYINDELEAGDTVVIDLYGISQRYFNYMAILTGIAGSSGGGPFTTPPATLRGNIINVTNPSNFVLGYFSLSEVDRRTYVVQ